MQKKPYIGVTDFTSRAQVEQIKTLFPKDCSHRLHVGAMISYNTLNGKKTETGWENIWLNSKGLNELFVNDPEVFNVIHYADYAQNKPTTVHDLLNSIQRCGPGLSGIQLDMIWPSQQLLQGIKDAYPHLDIILQVSSKAIEQIPTDSSLEKFLDNYKKNASTDYILLDYGMGRGIPFDPVKALELVDTALEYFTQDRIAVAGGLGPNTYGNLKNVLQKYPLISCDAQGKLRSSGSAADPLELNLVTQYVQGLISLLE